MVIPPNSLAENCPFCSLPVARIRYASESAVVVRDAFPVADGHTLIIPKRHVASFFDLTSVERESFMVLLEWSKADVERDFRPDAYNIGINDGVAAGQTVPHLHVHLIPRYRGDISDPRGGVRWVIPDKAKYWE